MSDLNYFGSGFEYPESPKKIEKVILWDGNISPNEELLADKLNEIIGVLNELTKIVCHQKT